MKSFGKRSTAMQVSADIDLAGRTAIVTGANTGIGKETARVLALRGAQVTLACRDQDKAAAAREDMLRSSGGQIDGGALETLQLDLNSLDGVRRFAAAAMQDPRPLDLLINNAGIMIDFERRTEDGFEAQLGINHLAHFLLTKLLLPRLQAADAPRVVCVSSMAMSWASLDGKLQDLNWERRKVKGMRAYGDSKLMNLMFARELTRRHGEQGIVAHALHPGVITTELGRDQGAMLKLIGVLALPFMKNVPQGAATTVFAATSPAHGDRSYYFSDCREAKDHHRLAGDTEIAGRLWERSAEMVGLA